MSENTKVVVRRIAISCLSQCLGSVQLGVTIRGGRGTETEAEAGRGKEGSSLRAIGQRSAIWPASVACSSVAL
jgi:hypothetical protein